MDESQAGLVYFWLALLLWDHAASYKTKPVSLILMRFVSLMFYFRSFVIAFHVITEWVTS